MDTPSSSTHTLITTDTGDPIVNDNHILLQRISDNELQSFLLTEEIMRAFNLIVNMADTSSTGTSSSVSNSVCASNIENRDTSEGGLKWTQQQTLLLIRLVESNYEKFNEGLKKNVWLKIAKELSSMTNRTFTAEQCDTKWKGLKRTYKTIKDHNNKSGNDRRKWEFFAAIDSFLSKKPEIEALSICSSMANKLDVRGDSNSEESTSSNTAVSAFTPQRTLSRRRKQSGGIEERHKEKMKKHDKFLKLFKIAVEHQTEKNISDDSD